MQRYYQGEYEGKSENRSLGGLISDLTSQLSTLVRQEIELARVELTQKASGMAKDAMMMGAGGALVYAGFLALLAAVAILLSKWMAVWLAFGVVAVVVLAAGAAFLMAGKRRLQKRDLKPTQTIISLKENKKWIKQQT
ncbi:MAG: phage holin family protein [Desulfobacteraceae bacterium]|nr:MAG: phage holin family protein [Desulfobacteraceae bacterium]